jgi:citrate synthase
MAGENRQVRSRNQPFARRTVTRIWQEEVSDENPYLATSCRCFGYDLLELMGRRSFVDVLYLLFRGELPNREQAKLLEGLMIALINPGPRHPATRAAMIAGVGKTDPVHILPIALSILGGSHSGAGSIEEGIRFFRNQIKTEPKVVAHKIIAEMNPPTEGDWHPVPGFGSRFGGVDPISFQIAERLRDLSGIGKALAWGVVFAEELRPHGVGWLMTGVAAAVFSDLGIHPRMGGGFYQLLSAPGLLAHGMEFANKPITAIPFPSDENYIIEYE